ncbi:putative SAC1-recessive suppressor of secretory defect [Mrakia frigida]|uniref:putative SAC1-recessive suppressor of secretory defect n=1 Tax=Mrakia frigida TaxID=29902 RepID=UPI003FCC15DE
MSSGKALHGSLYLQTSPEAYTLEAAATASSNPGARGELSREQIRFDRRTGGVSLESAKVSASPTGILIYGILGVVSLATVDLLILITSRSTPKTLFDQDIYLATNFLLLPLPTSVKDASSLADPRDRHLLKLVKTGLAACEGRLWFSYERDLTNSMDRAYKKRESTESLWEKAEDRFFWNRHMQSKLIDETRTGRSDLSAFILPVIFGSVVVQQAVINKKQFTFCLTSRRSRHRAGTRYFTRGVDAKGHTANSNETEQIVVVKGGADGAEQVFSYVQTRGSVPVFWTQINNLRYQPDLQVMDRPETADALKAHIDDQIKLYGDVYLVNLVNQKGYELPVKKAFEHAMQRLDEPHAHYTYFDFHAECKGMKFDKVSKLVNSLKEALDHQGFFQHSTGSDASEPVKLQKSVVRTNCMDSLDRTNVVQSALAKHVLNEQLLIAGVLNPGETIESHPDFMFLFRNIWADHADTISIPYSGTGALKTDFTRTGVRTKQGALQDGVNSVMRYVKNNFFDGARQDAFDLLTGAWNAHGLTEKSALDKMPYILFFSAMMLLASLVLPRQSHAPLVLFILPWLFAFVVSFAFIWGNGILYVSWPKLNPPSEILEYEGAGFKSLARGRGLDLPMLKGRAKRIVKKAVKFEQ